VFGAEAFPQRVQRGLDQGLRRLRIVRTSEQAQGDGADKRVGVFGAARVVSRVQGAAQQAYGALLVALVDQVVGEADRRGLRVRMDGADLGDQQTMGGFDGVPGQVPLAGGPQDDRSRRVSDRRSAGPAWSGKRARAVTR
jgi:hypothetical protein